VQFRGHPVALSVLCVLCSRHPLLAVLKHPIWPIFCWRCLPFSHQDLTFLHQLDRRRENVPTTLWWRLHDPNFNRLWLIHPCDRQTGGQTDGRWHIARYSIMYMLSRAKKGPSSTKKNNGTFRSYKLMPGFHNSVAVLPFCSYRCRCRWKRKCWKRLSVYIGMKWPERWLVVHQRQNGKNRIRSYCYGTAVAAQRQMETATAQRIFYSASA